MAKALEGFRLSPQQRHLWLLQQQGSTAYLAQCALRIRGELDRERLRQALAGIVRRHLILHTGFRASPGVKVPLQVILDEPAVEWSSVEPAGAEAAAVEAVLTCDRENLFDLEEGPLLRATLLDLGSGEHALVLTLPSLCADRRTLRNLFGELADSFAADAPAAGEPTQYLQYSDWQNELLADPAAETGRLHWRDPDLGLAVSPRLPFETRSSRAGRYQPAVSRRPLAAEPTAVAAACARHRISDEAFFLTCWQALLSRLSGERHLGITVEVEGRSFVDFAGAFGTFAKALPLAARFESDSRFGELSSRAGEALRQARAWQDHFDPGDAGTTSAAGPEGAISFELAEAVPDRVAGGLRFSVLRQLAVAARSRIKLTVERGDGGYVTEILYDPERFRRELVQAMMERLHRLIHLAIDEPEPVLSQLDLLGDAERHAMRLEWNDTQVAWPDDAPWVHRLIGERARQRSGAVAVSFEGQELTYAELDRRANQMANSLRKAADLGDAPVAVFMERSIEMIVALLGILKAGGAYLPLEPSWPAERLSLMLEESRTALVLTQERLLPLLPETRVRTLCLDSAWAAVAVESAVAPPCRAEGESPAYVIYTSGSTGRPKGVVNVHAALANRLLWMQDDLQFVFEDRVLQKTPFSFDVSVWELFLPLLTGACLVIAPPGAHQDASHLAELIAREQITVLHSVPSMLRLILDVPGIERCTSLRWIVCSGEALSDDLRRHCLDRLTAGFRNLYGPTEAAIDVTSWDCRSARYPGIVPIGRPIANLRIHILDRHLQPVPLAVPGELYIGGRGLARGYLERPDLTAERFVPDPCGDEPGARLYRSGDIARHLPDGSIEYLGRTDHQVKIRGFRIELGEIESVLGRHPAVREAAVVARPGGGGDLRLVAYLLLERGQRPALEDLRGFLARSLPDFMVPSAFVTLDSFPVTANGKLDRVALPVPGAARPQLGPEYVAPRTPTEELLAKIWSEVLGIEQIGIDDGFFALGGDSMRSVQAVALAKERGLSLSVQELVRHNNIRSLASVLELAMGLAPGVDASIDVPEQQENLAELLEAVEGLSPQAVREQLKSRIGAGSAEESR